MTDYTIRHYGRIKTETSNVPDRVGMKTTVIKDCDYVRDQFHSMDEVYKQRTILLMAIAKTGVLKSYKTAIEDRWFVGGLLLPSGQVGFHLEAHYYNSFNATMEKAPDWDGHDSQLAIRRLLEYINSPQ
jgi:hypothetical protein